MKALKFDPTLHKKSTTKKDQIEIDREGPRGRVSTHFLGFVLPTKTNVYKRLSELSFFSR